MRGSAQSAAATLDIKRPMSPCTATRSALRTALDEAQSLEASQRLLASQRAGETVMR
jgi:hypothetical protein